PSSGLRSSGNSAASHQAPFSTSSKRLWSRGCARTATSSNRQVMAEDFAQLTLTRHQQRLFDTSVAIRGEPPERIDFLHTIQCQCGIPYRNPGEAVREWDRRQGNASLR